MRFALMFWLYVTDFSFALDGKNAQLPNAKPGIQISLIQSDDILKY